MTGWRHTRICIQQDLYHLAPCTELGHYAPSMHLPCSFHATSMHLPCTSHAPSHVTQCQATSILLLACDLFLFCAGCERLSWCSKKIGWQMLTGCCAQLWGRTLPTPVMACNYCFHTCSFQQPLLQTCSQPLRVWSLSQLKMPVRRVLALSQNSTGNQNTVPLLHQTILAVPLPVQVPRTFVLMSINWLHWQGWQAR